MQRKEAPRGRAKSFNLPFVKRAIKGGLCLGVITACVFIWTGRQALITSAYQISANQGFALSDIHVKGRNFTSDAHIKSAVGASYGTPLLSLSLAEIQHNLEQLGWVKSAKVARIYPDAIEISLTERRPLALLQTTAGHRLIDETGSIIFGAQAANFSHLPVVSGEGAAEQAKFIIEELRTEPELFSDVWALQRVSNRRWDVHLKTGLAVRLPEKDAVLAWSKLAIIDRQKQIMKRDLAVIDMRVSGQFIVEPNLPLSKRGQKT
ncbi:MAG: cell division protein FtsQ/DivIB [Candidatus Puniceispirillaceae bacterium]